MFEKVKNCSTRNYRTYLKFLGNFIPLIMANVKQFKLIFHWSKTNSSHKTQRKFEENLLHNSQIIPSNVNVFFSEEESKTMYVCHFGSHKNKDFHWKTRGKMKWNGEKLFCVYFSDWKWIKISENSSCFRHSTEILGNEEGKKSFLSKISCVVIWFYGKCNDGKLGHTKCEPSHFNFKGEWKIIPWTYAS